MRHQKIAQMIRVNHAGEYGAGVIYRGQEFMFRLLGKHQLAELTKEMREQEQVHLDFFSEELLKRRVRPTILSPIWHLGGLTLGAISAAAGDKCAMATTIAVEEVIVDHYDKQLETLTDRDVVLVEKITQFRDDELEHQEIADRHDGRFMHGYVPYSFAVKTISKIAIFLSTRL